MLPPNTLVSKNSVSFILVITCLTVPGFGKRTGTEANLVELRIARQTPATGFVLERSASDSSFYVQRRVVIGDSDVKSARTAPSTKGLALTIRLTAAGADRFNSATKAHIRERLGVFIEGRLNSAPVIAQGMNLHADQPITIAVYLTDADAKRFAGAAAAKWPSAP